jgi:flagellar biogenesis protein FliO
MNHIKNIVADIIKSSNSETTWKTIIMQNWQEIMGSLAGKIFIEKITNDTIVLGVTDSCWMQELHMLSDVLKTKINNSLDKPRIKTLQFKYSSKKINRAQKIKTNVPLPYEFKPLTVQEEHALTNIKDTELSQALMRFLQKCQQSS